MFMPSTVKVSPDYEPSPTMDPHFIHLEDGATYDQFTSQEFSPLDINQNGVYQHPNTLFMSGRHSRLSLRFAFCFNSSFLLPLYVCLFVFALSLFLPWGERE